MEETLEEAILRIKSENEHYIDEVAFELGAKWQQERSKWKIPEFKHDGGFKKGEIYSYNFIKNINLHTNEEVLEILIKFWMWSTTYTRKEHLIKWFEQFKKK